MLNGKVKVFCGVKNTILCSNSVTVWAKLFLCNTPEKKTWSWNQWTWLNSQNKRTTSLFLCSLFKNHRFVTQSCKNWLLVSGIRMVWFMLCKNVWPLSDESGPWDSSWNSSSSVLQQGEKVKRGGCSISWRHTARPSELWENRHGARFTEPSGKQSPLFHLCGEIPLLAWYKFQVTFLLDYKNDLLNQKWHSPDIVHFFLQSLCLQKKKKIQHYFVRVCRSRLNGRDLLKK